MIIVEIADWDPTLTADDVKALTAWADSPCEFYEVKWGRERQPGSRPRIGTKLAYRVLWERRHGELPDFLKLHHLCENPPCVNLRHLIPLTQSVHAAVHGKNIVTNTFQLSKTKCPHDHLYDEDNTGYDKYGYRFCRTCSRIKDRKRRAAAKLARQQKVGVSS